ncbi:MAG: hypothetical protein ACFCBU_06030, partial [Cyanophyceae cyanobacterium]
IGLILASCFGGFWVAAGAGFQKSRQLDRLWHGIDDISGINPVLVVTEIETYAEVRGTVAFAYEWQRQFSLQGEKPQPQLLMLKSAHNRDGDQTPLAQALDLYQGQEKQDPLNLWTIDFSPELSLQKWGCEKQKLPRNRRKTGYRLRHHRCETPIP